MKSRKNINLTKNRPPRAYEAQVITGRPGSFGSYTNYERFIKSYKFYKFYKSYKIYKSLEIIGFEGAM